MTVAEDFMLLVTDPTTARCRLSSMITDIALGGATLIDLIDAERIAIQGEKRKARVTLVDPNPTGNTVIDEAIFRLQSKGPMRAQSAVRVLGKKMKQPLYEALSAHGLVRREPHKALGLFSTGRWPVIDSTRREDLIRRIQESLLHNQDADAETGPLIGLLAASDKLRIVVDRPEHKVAKARAKVIAEGDWASEEVRKAIQTANTVMMVAVISATSAGTGS